MSEENKSRSCEVVEYKENPDGSATISFDFTEEETQAFFRAGVLEALKRGIEQAESLNPSGVHRNHTFELTYSQIDSIMVKELQDIYERNLNETDGVREAAVKLLNYIMIPSEWDKWKNEKGIDYND